MLSRHRFAWIAGALLLTFSPASPASAASKPGRVEFEVLREGQPFGRQSVTVALENGQLMAQTHANLHAGLGPITLFSYMQRCSETWRAGSLTGLRCATRQNGRSKNAEGGLRDGALHISGVSGVALFEPSTRPTSWWTRPPLTTRQMINTETGARLPVRVSFVGREYLFVNGARIAADRIRVEGTLAVDLWYDDEGHWVGCAFTVEGQRISYRLLTPPSQAPA